MHTSRPVIAKSPRLSRLGTVSIASMCARLSKTFKRPAFDFLPNATSPRQREIQSTISSAYSRRALENPSSWKANSRKRFCGSGFHLISTYHSCIRLDKPGSFFPDHFTSITAAKQLHTIPPAKSETSHHSKIGKSISMVHAW